MRKLLLSILGFLIHSSILLQAQSGCDKIKFSGAAPTIWSINGQINDWETILGPGSGDPLFPFNPPASTFNYFNEIFDFDTPDPSKDLRAFAFVHDDYNVYFYLRRIQNGNAQNSFFYFFDINLDGLMSIGEPVVYANFNSKNIAPLAIGSYIPNTAIDYNVTGEGNYMTNPFPQRGCAVNGYSMKGDVSEIFNSASIPASNSLLEHEVFSAAITEDGYGIEFAVPWRYLKNWATNSIPLSPTQSKDLFSYHIAIQGGAGKYQPHKVADNAGGNNCGAVFPVPDLAISGFPSFDLINSSVQTLSPGSFRIKLTYQNLRNVIEVFELGDIILQNIQATEGAVPDVAGFVINAYIDKNCNQVIDGDEPANRYIYDNFSSSQDPIRYISGPVFLSVGVMQLVCVIVDIRFPENNSVTRTEIQFNPKASIGVANNCNCDECGPLDGGKPINPIGFTLGDEETTINKREYRHNSENTLNSEIRVYPNPSIGTINVILPNNNVLFNLTLADYLGRVIQKWSGIGQRIVKLENLKAGFYLLTVGTNDNNRIVTKKIIIQ